jgi:hypothetical protein
MRDIPAFNLADYAIDEEIEVQDSIPVFVTKQRFRIHPDIRRVIRVYLSRLDDKNWWLVKNSVKKATKIPKLWLADLHHGVLEDGTNFILPLTHPHHGYNGYHDSLKTAIEKARSVWCRVVTNTTERDYNILISRNNRSEPVWLDGPWSDFIEVAFQDYTINTIEQAATLSPSSRRHNLPEEFIL